MHKVTDQSFAWYDAVNFSAPAGVQTQFDLPVISDVHSWFQQNALGLGVDVLIAGWYHFGFSMNFKGAGSAIFSSNGSIRCVTPNTDNTLTVPYKDAGGGSQGVASSHNVIDYCTPDTNAPIQFYAVQNTLSTRSFSGSLFIRRLA